MAVSAVVYCSSSDNVSPMLFSEMELLGRTLAANGVSTVFGGSNTGLMKCLADSVLRNGGEITGVIPRYLQERGVAHPQLSGLEVVEDLLDRKRRMLELADIVICFPGGVGTLDEVTEIMALRQLGEIKKKIVFINFLGFWDPFFEFLDELKERHMLAQDREDLFLVCESSEYIVDFLSVEN